ncbi:MAG: hypothetical protein VKP62_09660 [Candidatus Sericytochromatia bacterium]|nr:hypothetical protein [Candidatus Sericytochromatia bacterium]
MALLPLNPAAKNAPSGAIEVDAPLAQGPVSRATKRFTDAWTAQAKQNVAEEAPIPWYSATLRAVSELVEGLLQCFGVAACLEQMREHEKGRRRRDAKVALEARQAAAHHQANQHAKLVQERSHEALRERRA